MKFFEFIDHYRIREVLLAIAWGLIAVSCLRADVLEDLQALPALASRGAKPVATDNVRSNCPPEIADQFARITGSWTLDWNAPTKKHIDDCVDRCQRTGAKLCVMASPKVPAMKAVLDDPELFNAELREHTKTWKVVTKRIDGRAEIASVVYDLERWRYKYDPRTERDRLQNRFVAQFNGHIYAEAKRYCGDDVQVHRYGHGALGRNSDREHGGWHAGAWSNYTDPVDGGFSISWYSPTDYHGTLESLRRVTERAKLHGVNRGSVWLSLGGVLVGDPMWLPEGHAYGRITSDVWAIPYDTDISRRWGHVLNHPWHDAVVNGESQHQGRFPPLCKVDQIFLWPCLMHPAVDDYGEHLVAFFRGCMRIDD